MSADEFITQLLKPLGEKGWSFAIDPEEKDVQGLIVGTPEYILSVISRLPGKYTIANPPKPKGTR